MQVTPGAVSLCLPAQLKPNPQDLGKEVLNLSLVVPFLFSIRIEFSRMRLSSRHLVFTWLLGHPNSCTWG